MEGRVGEDLVKPPWRQWEILLVAEEGALLMRGEATCTVLMSPVETLHFNEYTHINWILIEMVENILLRMGLEVCNLYIYSSQIIIVR